MEIAQFDLVNITIDAVNTHQRGVHVYSVIQTTFWLQRHTGYFMLQVCTDIRRVRVELGTYISTSFSLDRQTKAYLQENTRTKENWPNSRLKPTIFYNQLCFCYIYKQFY